MTPSIDPDQAGQFGQMREESPESLYRRGTRGRVSIGEPTGHEMLTAVVAVQLAGIISDVGLSILGASGLLQLSRELLQRKNQDQREEVVKEVKEFDDGKQVLEKLDWNIFYDYNEVEIRRYADQLVEERLPRSERERSSLDSLLGDEPFFRQ